MKLGFSTLNVEASLINSAGEAEPLAQQVFYILEKDPNDLLKGDTTSEIWYARAMNALRNTALTFVATNSQGKAEIELLKAGIYYVCGISYTPQEVVIWTVPIELKPGENSLVLNERNRLSEARA